MKLHHKLCAAAVCLLALAFAAPRAEAQCASSYVNTAHEPDFAKAFNDYGFLLDSAKNASCRVDAYNKLKAKLISTRLDPAAGANYYKQWLISGHVSLILATGMVLGGSGTFDASLDYELNFVASSYAHTTGGAAGDPCGIQGNDSAGKPFWRRANSCMDDHTSASQGWAWVALYKRFSGRQYATQRNASIAAVHRSLSTTDSICIHDRAKYLTDSNNLTVEANPCNSEHWKLDYAGYELVSLNHGNQSPAYGFGLLSLTSSAFRALEIMGEGIPSTEFTPDEKQVFEHLWREDEHHTTADGRFHANKPGGTPLDCYNMAGDPQVKRTLVTGWGCNDQQFTTGDPSEPGTTTCCLADKDGLDEVNENWTGYKAKFFPLARFYEKYGFEKGDYRTNGWGFNQFSEGTFFLWTDIVDWATDWRQKDSIRVRFFGQGRYELYRNLAWTWLDSTPGLTAGSEFRMAVKAPNSQFFNATSGGGSTIFANGTSATAVNSTLFVYDLNAAHLRSGDPVALGIKKLGSTYYLNVLSPTDVRINVAHSAPTVTATAQRFTIQKVSGSPGTLISDGDTFTLRSLSNNNYVVAANGGGGAILANGTLGGAWQTFTFQKTEQP